MTAAVAAPPIRGPVGRWLLIRLALRRDRVMVPVWYAVLQGLSALALIGVAVLTRGSALSAVFPAPDKK